MRFASSRLLLFSAMMATSIAVGCKAQDPSAKASVEDSALARRIEILVRGQFNVPAEYSVTLGARKPSNIPGYDTLKVTIARGPRTTDTDFLISSDNKTLARLETFSLTNIPALNIPLENRPIRGNPAAKVTVVNFDDLECPYCARMHQQLFPSTLARYGDKVRFVYKDDPLVEIHPWAMHASIDAGCLADQNGSAYWGYVDYLHAHGQEVSGEDRDPKKSGLVLDKIAREQGKIFSLDAAKLDSCLQKQDQTAVQASMKQADSLGVEGTPFIFVNGEKVNGVVPAEQLWMVIDRALRAAGVEPPPSPASQSAPMPAPSLTN